MVRKKNKMFVDSADRTPHYSLRKLSVGVASVLLSTTLWMGANGSVAHADTEPAVRSQQNTLPTGQASEQANGQVTGKESNTTKQETSDDLDGKKGNLSSLIDQAKKDGLTVTKEEGAKTYATKQDALADLDNQTSYIQSKVTKYEAEKEAYDAAKKVYDEDLAKWNVPTRIWSREFHSACHLPMNAMLRLKLLPKAASRRSTSLSPVLGRAMAMAYILMA